MEHRLNDINRYRFFILVITVAIAGLSQGLLLPLLAILLEQSGVSSVVNGLNTTGLYLGILLFSPFIERPLRKWGYKPIIIGGIILVTGSTLLFPVWQNLAYWFILRVLVGIGDSSLHFATQLWITSTSSAKRRGRDISIYGLAYGMGFGVGPLGINLIPYGLWSPFAVVALFYIMAIFLVLRLKNDYPEKGDTLENNGKERYFRSIRLAWFALLPGFLYGLLEASLNGNFPVYALRVGLSEEWISILLPSFVFGSLLLQIPLGILSDKFGRKKILMVATFAGGILFLLVPFTNGSPWLLMAIFLLVGGFVGSLFSLGLAYLADILPKSLLPTANIIAGMNFSIGSILGPNIGGISIQYMGNHSMFYMLSGFLIVFSVAGISFKKGLSLQSSNSIAK
ncbi:MFS transporter [Microaerobacter geothermalis]|uniref:MFS transporter n=1 Tax=Microaerobacter geothermalis TaxID=674972 RepID=UPI001F22C55D|nr:MFS transporter [Microaerobacter geothermalis]MCF6093662.1 MFS transporter [Microaerobacter geothermalis]